MRVTRTITVTARGIGKPDYTREVSSSQQRAGYRLHYGDILKYLAISFTDLVPTPYINPTIQPKLAAGASAHLIDPETGLATGITVPAGYIGTLMQWGWTGDQDLDIWHYVEYLGALRLAGSPGVSGPGASVGFNLVIPPSTAYFDPLAAVSHVWDVVVTNRGTTDDLSGTIDFGFILEPMGTDPPPTTKVCKCPFCGHEEKKPVITTSVDCSNCGQRYILWDLTRVKK